MVISWFFPRFLIILLTENAVIYEINLRNNIHLAYELQDFMEKVGREVAEELLEPF